MWTLGEWLSGVEAADSGRLEADDERGTEAEERLAG